LKGHGFTDCKKLDRDRFCNKGPTSVGPQIADKNERALQAAEKGFCRKFLYQGTTLVVPNEG
jgi:hypothetical protein